MTDLHHTTQTVELTAPDGSGPYDTELEIWWKLIHGAVPAKMYGPNAGPAEPAEWEIDSIKVEE